LFTSDFFLDVACQKLLKLANVSRTRLLKNKSGLVFWEGDTVKSLYCVLLTSGRWRWSCECYTGPRTSSPLLNPLLSHSRASPAVRTADIPPLTPLPITQVCTSVCLALGPVKLSLCNVQHFSSVFQRWKFMRSSMHHAVDWRKIKHWIWCCTTSPNVNSA